MLICDTVRDVHLLCHGSLRVLSSIFPCHCDIQDPVRRTVSLFAGKMSSDLLKIDCEALKKREGGAREKNNTDGQD